MCLSSDDNAGFVGPVSVLDVKSHPANVTLMDFPVHDYLFKSRFVIGLFPYSDSRNALTTQNVSCNRFNSISTV